MNASIRRYRIVVGVDLTEYSTIVIEHALDQAARHQLPELHFLYVDEKGKRPTEQLNEYLSTAVYPALQVFNQHGSEWRARLHVRRGKPDEQIAGLAADVLSDLIVVGQFGLHKRGIATRVLKNATCATLVVGMPKLLDATQCGECAAPCCRGRFRRCRSSLRVSLRLSETGIGCDGRAASRQNR